MFIKLINLVAITALSASSFAQTQLVFYNPSGTVDEIAGLSGTTGGGVTASSLRALGVSAGAVVPDTFHTFDWSNGPSHLPSKYLEFSVTGSYVPGRIVIDWFQTTFGPTKVKVRSSQDGFIADIAVADKSNVVTLDLSSMGPVTGTTTYRLYYYDGTPGPDPTTNAVFIDGTNASGVGLKLFSALVPDDCSQAIALPSTFAVTPYVGWGATTDGQDHGLFCDIGDIGDDQGHNDIWFTYTPAVGGCTYISTLGLAGYDTRLTIYQGYSCPDNAANIIACVDDEVQPAVAPFEAGFDVFLLAGQTYTIRLSTNSPGIANQNGSLRIAAGPGADLNSGGLNPGAPNCPPLNDDCGDAVALPSSFADTPYDATLATTDGMDYTGFCDDGFSLFGGQQNYNDIWFTYTPAVGGCTYISTFGLAGYDTNLTVYQGYSCPADSASIIACADDEVQPEEGPFEAGLDVILVAGETYTIRLGTQDGSLPASSGTLRIAAGPGASANSGGANPGAPGCEPSNDDCAGAIALPSTYADTPYDATYATTDGQDYTGFCDDGFSGGGGQQNYQDLWFTYTPDIGGCTYISTFGLAGYDTNLTVYGSTACPDDPAFIIACADDEFSPATVPFEAGLDVELVAGETYLIRLGTSNSFIAGSSGVLRVAAGPGAYLNSGGANPGAPDCLTVSDECSGDGGDQLGCSNCPCTNNAAPGTVGGCLNSAGTSTRIAATGDTSASLPPGVTTDLRFTLSNAPPGALCVMLSGSGVAPQSMGNMCFGLNSGAQSLDRDGLRCAVMNLKRHGGRVANVMGDVVDPAGPSRVWGGEAQPNGGLWKQGGFVAGQTRFFQVTYRENALAGCMRGLNTSQAVRVIFTP